MAKKTYIALEPIRHDGEDVAPGSPISLEETLGAKHKAAGLVRDITAQDKAPKAPAQDKAPADGEEKQGEQ